MDITTWSVDESVGRQELDRYKCVVTVIDAGGKRYELDAGDAAVSKHQSPGVLSNERFLDFRFVAPFDCAVVAYRIMKDGDEIKEAFPLDDGAVTRLTGGGVMWFISKYEPHEVATEEHNESTERDLRDAVELLAQVQWSDIGWDANGEATSASCPSCGHLRESGHAGDCDIARLIRKHGA